MPAETGAPEITCPCCGVPFRPTRKALQAMVAELRGWDRLGDDPQTIVDAIFACLEAEHEPELSA